MKNLLFGALIMLMGTFAFASSDVEIHSNGKLEKSIELFANFEYDNLNSKSNFVGCYSNVYVYKMNKDGTKKLVAEFTYYDEECTADYQMERVYI